MNRCTFCAVFAVRHQTGYILLRALSAIELSYAIHNRSGCHVQALIDRGEENISRKGDALLSQTGHFQVLSFLPEEPQTQQSGARHSVIKSA